MKALSQAYLQEAIWCDKKYVPTYDEYMKIALVTSPYPHATVACFLGMGDIATKEVFEWACQDPMPNVIKAASTILRLMDDLGGHKVRTSMYFYAGKLIHHMHRSIDRSPLSRLFKSNLY